LPVALGRDGGGRTWITILDPVATDWPLARRSIQRPARRSCHAGEPASPVTPYDTLEKRPVAP
jgi:hypothetical protein